MRQHRPNLVQAASVKLHEQMTLAGNAGHGSGQYHVKKRRLAARTNDPHRAAIDLQVGFVSADELRGFPRRDRIWATYHLCQRRAAISRA